MDYRRMPIEIESPESLGYDSITCNLAESSVRDLRFGDLNIDLNNIVMAYGDHVGKPELRELIAGEHEAIWRDDVLMTIGAAGALFIVHSSLLTPNDHIVVVRPNYATNIATPLAIGCGITYIDLEFKDNYRLTPEKIIAELKPNTKLISITTPHNPTGTVLDINTISLLCRIAEENNCLLLVDETYRDLAFQTPPPIAASISSNAISISSVSKSFGIPGIRLGWIIAKDKKLQHRFLAAKEQIHISNSVIDEEICYQYLVKKEDHFASMKNLVQTNFKILKAWISDHPSLDWVEPSGGCVCFPKFKKDRANEWEKFYKVLLSKYGTYVGPGHWFDQTKRYFRLGFGWETSPVFQDGLRNIDRAISDCEL